MRRTCLEQCANLTRFKDRETVAVRGIADDDIAALVSEPRL